jgi:hypothetical protein
VISLAGHSSAATHQRYVNLAEALTVRAAVIPTIAIAASSRIVLADSLILEGEDVPPPIEDLTSGWPCAILGLETCCIERSF